MVLIVRMAHATPLLFLDAKLLEDQLGQAFSNLLMARNWRLSAVMGVDVNIVICAVTLQPALMVNQ